MIVLETQSLNQHVASIYGPKMTALILNIPRAQEEWTGPKECTQNFFFLRARVKGSILDFLSNSIGQNFDSGPNQKLRSRRKTAFRLAILWTQKQMQ